MNILIADDEPLAQQRLAQLVSELDGDFQLMATAANGQEAVSLCETNPIDLILMDVRMPGMGGIEAAEVLRQLPVPPAIVFTTAFEQHALAAFETNAVDYLLKPIRKDRLLAALNKATSLSRAQLDAIKRQEQEKFISASYRGGLKRIPLDDVIFLHADSKYVVVRHLNGEALVEESLKSLEQRFESHFLRIHRNALVDTRKVIGLEKTKEGKIVMVFSGLEDKLEISRRHLAYVRKMLKG